MTVVIVLTTIERTLLLLLLPLPAFLSVCLQP